MGHSIPAHPEHPAFLPWCRFAVSEENQAAFDKALKKRETHEVVFAAIGGPKLKD